MARRWTLILLVAMLLAGCSRTPGQGATAPSEGSVTSVGEGEIEVGQPVPRFTLQTTSGQALSSEALKGQIMVINFWATWCPPCRQEMPEFQDAYAAHADDGLTIIGVEIEGSGSEEESRDFLKEAGVTFPTVRDADGTLERAFLEMPAYPTTLFVDREGIIQHIQIGPVTKELLEQILADVGL